MVFVPADAANVVPGVGLVAEVALLDSRVMLPSHHHGKHVEVVHIVAGRRLVALRTFDGAGRRMLEARDLPGCGQVARRTFLAEQVAVRATIAMAAETVEDSPVIRPADCLEDLVIHANRPNAAFMFDMACGASSDGGVKGRRLTGQRGCVGGVTRNARRGLHSLQWHMTGLTLV